MTSPPQPVLHHIPHNNRKRPAPGTAPIASPILTPATPSAAAAPSRPEMNYGNMLPLTNGSAGSAGSGARNMYGNDPSMSMGASQDPYGNPRDQNSAVVQSNNMYSQEANNQLARVNRPNQMMRIPQFGLDASRMSQALAHPSGQMNMVPYTSQPLDDGMGQMEPDLSEKIAKMRKKRASIPPFVLKLSSFVNDEKNDHLIRWSPSGNSFLVLDEDEFSKKCIPEMFKHNNYASFVRQLNMYGFHKVVGLADGSLKTSEQRSKPPSEYENPYFKRGQPDLMWLIQKPSIKARKGKKGTKQEDGGSDREGEMSDGGEGGGGGGSFIEGSKGEGNQATGGNQRVRPDIQALMSQVDAVRHHQAMISAAIQRLRKDHQQLYEQSVAFQTLHQKHENSINAILGFLATVYKSSIEGGHLNGAFNSLFASQSHQGLEQPQQMHRQNSLIPNMNGKIVSNGTPNRQNNVMHTPQMPRRKPLLLEEAPSSYVSEGSYTPAMQATVEDLGHEEPPFKIPSSPMPQGYHYSSPIIKELFTPSTGAPPSPTDSPKQEQDHPQQHGGNQSTNDQIYSPIFNLPDSPVGSSPAGLAHNISRRSITPFPANTTQVMQKHNDELAEKSRQIQELEDLQLVQDENVNELMSMMQSYTNDGSASMNGADDGNPNMEQYLDFNDLGLDMNGIPVSQIPYTDVDQQGLQSMPDIESLLGNMQQQSAENIGNGTNPSTVVASPGTSSVGSRAREELEEEAEEISPKRRRVA